MKPKIKSSLTKFFSDKKKDLLLAILSSVFIISLTYKFNLAPFFAIIPLLLIVYRRNFKTVLLFSAFTGLVSAIFMFDWVYYYGSYFPLYPMVIALWTLFFITFSALTHLLYNRMKFFSFFAAPVVWVWIMFLLDFTKYGSYIFEFSMYNPSMAPLIWWVGSRGITFIIIALNSAVAEFIIKRTKTSLIITTILILSLLGCYFYSINAEAEGEPFKVALVQGNFEETWEWRQTNLDQIFNAYATFDYGKVDLIVWPEHTFPVDIIYFYTDIFDKVKDFVKNSKAYLITGSLIYDENTEYHYDSALLFSPAGELLDTYKSVSPAFYNEDTISGKEGTKIFNLKGKKAGIMICAEETISKIARTQSKNGAQFFISISNDQNFRRGIHLSSLYSRLRAAENHKYLIRATNTGITQITNPYGKTQAIEESKRNILIGEILLNEHITFYTKYGNIPLYIITLLIFTAIKRRSK